ncbi:MAG: Nif3-like dinuclear metal center hexameric protein [Anaerolineae bacterium]|nr:Nif3-like dinuclear metal center hexameric protein [Anaerolineae bacterium]
MAITIEEAIATIVKNIPGAPFPDTVDTVKTGDTSQVVKGIIVTFLTSCEIIEQAVQQNANFIITHEPTFYNHADQTDWLADDPVYQAKRRMIAEHNLVVWRFHDYLHTLQPDITVVGAFRELGWEAAMHPEEYFRCQLPPTTLGQLVSHVKARLGIDTVRVVGDLDMPCQKIGLLPGFPPYQMQMGFLGHPEVEVLICGEIHEWETLEYARDAIRLGHKKALVVIGHAASEEPGMKWIVPWIQNLLPPDVPIQFVPTRKVLKSV